MSAGDEYEALLHQIDHTDYGEAETALLRKALAAAAERADDAFTHRVRLRAMQSAAFNGREAEVLEHFAWCLEHHRVDGRAFPAEEAGIQLLDYFPRAVNAIATRPETPEAALDSVISDYETQLRRAGHSPRKAWEMRVVIANRAGRFNVSREWRERLTLEAGTEGRHCAGCEVSLYLPIEADDGTPASTMALLEGISPDQSCQDSQVWHATSSLVPLAQLGRGAEALEAHRWSSRVVRRNPASETVALSYHAEFCALSGQEQRALTLLSLFMGRAELEHLDNVTRFWTSVSAWVTLRAVLDDAADPSAVVVPGAGAWAGLEAGSSVGGETLAAALWSWAEEMAAAFDARDASPLGPGGYGPRLARAKERSRERLEVPWQEQAPDIAQLPAGPAVRVAESAAERPRDQQEWLDEVCFAALEENVERAEAALPGALEACTDPWTRLELFSEAIDVLPEQNARWYAERAALFEQLGFPENARLEAELHGLMNNEHEVVPADIDLWEGALAWATHDGVKAEVLTHLANTFEGLGRDEEALEAVRRAVPLAHAMSARGDQLWVYAEATRMAVGAEQLDEALGYSDEAAELALVGERNAMNWRHNRGLVMHRLDRIEESTQLLRDAADIALAHGARDVGVRMLNAAGTNLYYVDRNVEGAALLRLALAIAKEDHSPMVNIVTTRLASALEDAGEPDEAADLLEALVARLALDPGAESWLRVEATRGLGDALRGAGDIQGARAAWSQAIDLTLQAQAEPGSAVHPKTYSHAKVAAEGLTGVAAHSGDADVVVEASGHAVDFAKGEWDTTPATVAAERAWRAQLLARVGELDLALSEGRAARAEQLALGEAEAAADTLDTIGRILVATGNEAEGITALLGAAEEFEEQGQDHQAGHSRMMAIRGMARDDRGAEALAAADALLMAVSVEDRQLRVSVGSLFAELLEDAGKDERARQIREMIEHEASGEGKGGA